MFNKFLFSCYSQDNRVLYVDNPSKIKQTIMICWCIPRNGNKKKPRSRIYDYKFLHRLIRRQLHNLLTYIYICYIMLYVIYVYICNILKLDWQFWVSRKAFFSCLGQRSRIVCKLKPYMEQFKLIQMNMN